MPANSQSWQRLLHERGRQEGQPSSLSPGPAAMAERLWAQTRFPSRPLSALAVEKYLEAGAFGSRYRSRLHHYVRASASRVVCRRGQGSVTRTHAHTHARTHARTAHTYTHARTHARTHAHTRTHTHTHERAPTHARTHTHTWTHAPHPPTPTHTHTEGKRMS